MQGGKVFEIFVVWVAYADAAVTFERSVIAIHFSSHSVAIIDELLPIQCLCFA